MKACKICGILNADGAVNCAICGSVFDNKESEQKVENNINKYQEVSFDTNINSNFYNLNQMYYVPLTPNPEKNFRDKQAIAALILSLVSMIFCFAAPMEIISLILGVKGLKSEKYKSMALSAIFISIIGLIVFSLLLAAVIINFDYILNFLKSSYYL